MRRVVLAWVGGVVLALVVVAGAVAQSAPWRVVQGSDGTLYVIKDGVRYTLVADPITDDDLAALPDGGSLGPVLPMAEADSPGTTATRPTAGPTASMGVQFDSVLGGRPGQSAHVVVRTDPGAACSLQYVTPAGTESKARGLERTTADSSGVAAWSWIIGAATKTGTGTLTVTCNAVTASASISIG